MMSFKEQATCSNIALPVCHSTKNAHIADELTLHSLNITEPEVESHCGIKTSKLSIVRLQRALGNDCLHNGAQLIKIMSTLIFPNW